MTCLTEGQLNDYVSGRLSTQERWELGRHLEACPECQKQADELRAAGKWLDLLGQDEGANQHVKPEVLAALVEGTLASAPRAQVLAHVGTCPECATVLGLLQRGRGAEADQEQAAARASGPGPAAARRHRVGPWSALAAAAAAFVVVGSILLTQFADRGVMAPGPVSRSEQVLGASAPRTEAAVGERPSEAAAKGSTAAEDKRTGVPAAGQRPLAATGAEPTRAPRDAKGRTVRAPVATPMGGNLASRPMAKALTDAGSEATRIGGGAAVPPAGRPAAVAPPAGRGGRPGGPGMPPGPWDPGRVRTMAPAGVGGLGGGPEAEMSRAEIPGPGGSREWRAGDGVGAETRPGLPAPTASAATASANNQVARRLPPANSAQVPRREPTPEKAHPAETARGDEADTAEVSQQASVHAQPLRNQKARLKPEAP